MIPNKPENVPTEGVNGDVLILKCMWSYFLGRAPDESPSSVRSRQPHLGSYGRTCGQKSLQREAGGGYGKVLPEGLSQRQEATLMVWKLWLRRHIQNCTGAPRQDSFPMLSGVSQCVLSLRHPQGWGAQGSVFSGPEAWILHYLSIRDKGH